MTFIINISKEKQRPLSENVLRVLSGHMAKQSPAETLNSKYFSAATVGPVKASSYNDGVTIIIVGRPIFNFARAQEDSLTDVIHSLYRRFGENFIDNVKGGFGIIVVDGQNGKVFAFRDRMGFYPVFYCLNDNGLWLSNSMKPILASRSMSFSLDHKAIYRYLYLKAFESPDSAIKEIRSLEPGCFLLFADKSVGIKQYWDIPVTGIYADNARHDGSNEELIDLLKTALRDQLSLSKSHSGLLLSGGIDSSILAALSAGHDNRGQNPMIFNVNFSGQWQHLDESIYAEKVAQLCGLKLQKIEFNISNFLKILPALFWNNNLPTANTGFKISLVAEQGFTQDIDTYMLGEGADTLLDYSWKWKYFNMIHKAAFFMNFVPESYRTSIFSFFEELIHSIETHFIGKQNPVEILRSYLASNLGYWKWKGSSIRVRELKRLFNEELRGIIGGRLITDIFLNYYKKVDSGGLAEKLIYSTLKSYSPNQQLMNYQTISNYYGADMFCPYLDERVIEYCLKLPVDRRVGKKILRSIAGRLVPQEVITREKRVFIVPMGTWMKDSLKPFVDLVFSEKNLEKRGIFNVMEMIKLKGSFDRGEFQSWSDIWSFVLLEAWLRINYDKAFPEKPENVYQVFPELEMPRNISNP